MHSKKIKFPDVMEVDTKRKRKNFNQLFNIGGRHTAEIPPLKTFFNQEIH